MVAENEAQDQVDRLTGSRGIDLASDERIEIIDFGQVQAGDVVLGSEGRTTVVEAFEEHIPEEMLIIETDSGIELEVSGNHLVYIVSALDRDLHRKRLADGKKLGRSISQESVSVLEELAVSAEKKEGFIAEFEHFIEPKSPELRDVLVRVAESLGPSSEANLYVDDLDVNDAPLFSATVRNYDRKLFAQQLLSVLAIGKARKRWPPIVGSVVPAIALLDHNPQDIYIPDPPEVREEKN